HVRRKRNESERILVYPHPRRQPLSWYLQGRAPGRFRLHEAGRGGGRHARLRRRAAADWTFVRGCVGGGIEPDRRDEEAEIPCGGTPRPEHARSGRAHGGDL